MCFKQDLDHLDTLFMHLILWECYAFSSFQHAIQQHYFVTRVVFSNSIFILKSEEPKLCYPHVAYRPIQSCTFSLHSDQ